MKYENSKTFFYIFIFFYLLIVSITSLNVGISHDEQHHHEVWLINKKIYFNYFFGDNYEIIFKDFGMNFYGIGFQILSLPIENFLKFIFSSLGIFQDINYLIIKHPSIVILFTMSGIYFKKIIKLITNDELFSNISSITYLMYPYLVGHSLFNNLDIPFMSIWLICTFYIMKISKSFIFKQIINFKDLIILSFLTDYLFSIRISCILILFEYLIFSIFVLNLSKTSILNFVKIFYKKILISLLIFLFFFYFFHPNYWNDPLKVYDSFRYMSQHIQTVCTITLGECMKAQNLPSTYIPLWLFFKLPILVILGIFLFPLIEKKLFKKKIETIYLGSLLISILTIILLLIFFKIHLYDEIRQILFLIPLIFVVSLSFFYLFSKKISFSLCSIFIIFFLFQNIKIFPYNYLWLNNFSQFININQNFEKDYWGLASREISKYFNKKKDFKTKCIISNRNKAIESFLYTKNSCFINFRNLHNNNERPFYVVLAERALNKGVPNNCKKIYDEKFNMNFSRENVIVAKIYECL